MARSITPIAKRCKALGISPAALGYTNKETKRNPKGQVRRKQSEYGLQLQEKQKVKFIYGVLEKQFRHYFEMAQRRSGQTGENLLRILECRLDNVVFRLGFATTRPEARQLVLHGHFTVNGRRVNIPSFQVKAGDVIAVCEKSRSLEKFKTVIEANSFRTAPQWLDLDRDNAQGRVINLPEREDIDLPIEEHLIVELYSK